MHAGLRARLKKHRRYRLFFKQLSRDIIHVIFVLSLFDAQFVDAHFSVLTQLFLPLLQVSFQTVMSIIIFARHLFSLLVTYFSSSHVRYSISTRLRSLSVKAEAPLKDGLKTGRILVDENVWGEINTKQL